MTTQRKVAVRAFSGLSGSPLAKVNEAVVEQSTNPAAIRARARRAANAAKLEKIKESLRVPLAERVAAEKVQAQQEREKAEQQKAHDEAMKPTLREWEKAREERAERQVLELHENRDALDRRHFHDKGDNLDFASERDQSRTEFGGRIGGHKVRPEGTGTVGGDDPGDELVGNGVLDPDDNNPIPVSHAKFGVRVGNSPVNQSKLRAMLGEDGYHEPTAFVVVPDSDRYRCVCCGLEDDWLRTMRNHIESGIEHEMFVYKSARAKAKAMKEALGEMLIPPGQPIVIEKPERGAHAALYHNFKV